MEVLVRHLEPLGKPCLYGLPLGHGRRDMPIANQRAGRGVPVALDAGDGRPSSRR